MIDYYLIRTQQSRYFLYIPANIDGFYWHLFKISLLFSPICFDAVLHCNKCNRATHIYHFTRHFNSIRV